jgi:hypothetical protein
MAYRRLMRQYHGTVEPSHSTRAFWMLAFLMCSFGLLGVSATGSFNVELDLSQNVLSFLVSAALLYGALKTIVVIRWCLYWLLIAITLMLFIDGSPNLADLDLYESEDGLRRLVLIWLWTIEGLTLVIWFLIVHVYVPRNATMRNATMLPKRSTLLT